MSDDETTETCTPLEEVGLAGNDAAFPVVGVGASAGGLEALRLMLGALPTDTGMGFVIVQHLAPAHASSLAEILSRATAMPVCEVRDEPAVEPDHVYVIPPGRDMIITGGKLRLLPQKRGERHRGIDQFFRSLAQESGHQAIGVVLSGSASDGTLGLEVIKAEGGVTFAQDQSAQHDSMPKSAVASGCVDFVLPPEGIAREIARIARHPYVAAGPKEDGRAKERGDGRIAEIVRRATGVDFTHYKANTMQRRIQRRMMVHKIATLAEYEEHLRATPGEIEALYQDVLISVTSFFRNPEAFETLAKKVFKKLLADSIRHEPVRIWTLGCSTGEEAYSLAIIFAECAEAANSTRQLQLFASDLNASVIEKARAGRYPRSIVQDVSPERLRKFFVEEDGHYRVSKSIRERIVFSRHDVLADPPFSRVDFISCRNLLIYLEPVLQQQVLPLLHYALKPGGFLWLGSSESLGTSREFFEVEDARQKIFTRKPGPSAPSTRFRPALGGTNFSAAAPARRDTPATQLHRDAERVLLAKYAPPGVVVTAELEIVQFRGETGAYLAPAAGLATHELLKMLREGLLVPVRAAITRARSESRAVREEGVRVRSDGGHRELAIEVIPLKAGPGREFGFVILFDEGTTSSRGEKVQNLRSEIGNNNDEVARLTQELAATREYLQSVIEQQDAANEELQSANEEAQSANEEMQSVNEELETSKEEIQSSNEELATVNDELNHRNHELNRLNNDLTNVLANAQLSILIVSRDLRIRRFTPVAEKMLNLAGSDVGRPLGEIRLSLVIPDLEPLLREVIDTVSPREREVQDAQGRWFSLRARPYLSHDHGIDGAVVTLVDVDTLRRAHDYAQSIVANVRGPLVVLDAALRVKTASPAFYEHFRVTRAQTEGRYIYDLGNGQWDIPALRTLLEEVLPQEHAVSDYEVRHTFEQLGPRVILVHARRLAQAPAEEPLIILSIDDITERQRGEALLAGQKEAFEMAAKGTPLLEVLEFLMRAAESQSPARARMAIHLLDEAGAHFVQTAAPSLPSSYRAAVDGMPVTPPVGSCCAAVTRRERVVVSDIAGCTEFPQFADFAVTFGLRAACSTPIFSSIGRVLATFVCYYGETSEPGPQDDVLGEIATRTASLLIERDQASEAVRVSEERYRTIIDSSPDCIKLLDLEGNLLTLEAGEELLGITDVAPLLGKSWIEFWKRNEDRAAAVAAVATAAAGGEGKFVGFFRTLHDVDKWWDVAVTPVRDARGHPAQLLAVSRDVTERHDMEGMLVARAAELAQADRSKDEFLAMLAHELRNPLAPLRTATEILQASGVSDGERAEARRIIGRQIENMSRMIDDLLDVSRITEGKIELRKKAVSLETVLTASTSLARSGCAARHQELTLSMPAEPIFLDADPTRLEQVFGNLLTNACKYSGDGCHIALRAERDEGEVIVSVSDDGAGIAPELLPRIFDLFVQASRTLDRVHGGLGIGLTLVQRLVKLHNGSIEARSEGLGHGAEFIVRLPILAETPPAPPLSSAVEREAPRRILIVDDNKDSARSLAILQTRHGHVTKTAFTGPDAVTAASEFLPEVVILDIGLPGMDGFEVARRIRAIPALEGAFIIAMSGYGSPEDRNQASAAGFDEYMVKPADLDILRDLLRARDDRAKR